VYSGRDLSINGSSQNSSALPIANQTIVPGGAAKRRVQDKLSLAAHKCWQHSNCRSGSKRFLLRRSAGYTCAPRGATRGAVLLLRKRLHRGLNQAIVAQEDVEGFWVMNRVRFIMRLRWGATWPPVGYHLD
jgi:hypothetical protein